MGSSVAGTMATDGNYTQRGTVSTRNVYHGQRIVAARSVGLPRRGVWLVPRGARTWSRINGSLDERFHDTRR